MNEVVQIRYRFFHLRLRKTQDELDVHPVFRQEAGGKRCAEDVPPNQSAVPWYNYVDLGLLPIKNIDLPEKLRRNTKAKKARENKKNLGRSIEERPEIVEFRTEFGHWEIDTVIGKKDEGEPCVLTLTERMT